MNQVPVYSGCTSVTSARSAAILCNWPLVSTGISFLNQQTDQFSTKMPTITLVQHFFNLRFYSTTTYLHFTKTHSTTYDTYAYGGELRRGESCCDEDEDGTIVDIEESPMIGDYPGGCSPSLPNAGLRLFDELCEGLSACLCADDSA
jgi:hypothetical protein